MTPSKQRDGFELSRTGRTLPMMLLRAREQVMDRFRPMLLKHGITEQQWRVIRVLHESDGMDATELAARASVLAPSLSRIIKTLEERKFLASKKDPKDGRRAVLKLTDAGNDFIQRVAPESAKIYTEIESLLGQERIEKLLDDIEDLIAQLSKN